MVCLIAMLTDIAFYDNKMMSTSRAFEEYVSHAPLS